METNSKSGHTILVVEDDKGIQDAMKIALEYEGYKVLTADNGKQGIEILNKVSKPCLILLDLLMPVMNGVEFIEEMGKQLILATIPVVIVTAYGDQAKTIVSKGVVEKPIQLNVLLEKVREWCG